MKYAWVGMAALLGFAGYYFLYPSKILERKTAQEFAELAAAVESQDRAKVGESLTALLTDNAQVHLEVRFFSITQLDGGKPVLQDYDKASFITFIDNILYTVEDYHYQPSLESFTAGEGNSADVTFSSKEWADGDSVYAGTKVKMRFSTDTTCTGHLTFASDAPLFDKIDCQVFLRSIPKPSEYKKMQNPEALGQFLR